MEDQKFAFAHIADGRIYLCQKMGDFEQMEFEAVASGRDVAVAFDRTGELFVARKTAENKLYVAPANNLSAEEFLAEGVTSFDICRSNVFAKSSLACVFVSGQKLFLKERQPVGVWKEQELVELPAKIVPVRVRFARGAIQNNVIVVTDGRGASHLFGSVENPNASERWHISCKPSIELS